jgi:UDP-GlcNAc:undecaprenyl-phosphate/decaprenyl-phosphate GlcNAc-1-phosphate transferase
LTYSAAFGIAALVAWFATPVAMRVARRTKFYDVPSGYKGHRHATPYLGGTAVMLAFVVSATLFSHDLVHWWVIVGAGVAMLAIGTVDDRIALPPLTRLAAESAVAVVLWSLGLGWTVFSPDALNLLLTVIWVIGLINAFNLMDNLDGALGTVAAVSLSGVAALAVAEGQPALACLALALAGACVGFLPYNLAGPARIFLGDGGSMSIGAVAAISTMVVGSRAQLGEAAVLDAALLVGLPIFDTALVVFSRRRRGLSIVTAGRDHLTHRLLAKLGTPRRVAAVLATAQLFLCAVALVAYAVGIGAVTVVAAVATATGLMFIAWQDLPPRWRPTPPPPASSPERSP